MPQLNIGLPLPQARFLEEQVASGRDASDVVAEALRRYEQERATQAENAAFHTARSEVDYTAGRYNTYADAQERRASMHRLVAEARERGKARTVGH
jgi:Arc/MetJ-type ribon-helix-helix transcriptional regulator